VYKGGVILRHFLIWALILGSFIIGAVWLQNSFMEANLTTVIQVIDKNSDAPLNADIFTIPNMDLANSTALSGKGRYIYKIPSNTLALIRVKADGYKTKYAIVYLKESETDVIKLTPVKK
jgi:hypothetical protein